MTRKGLCCWRDWLYKVHIATGLVAALWLLLIAVTGVLINHQEEMGLWDIEISDQYLPNSYRADVRTGATRLNVIVTDLHSGRIFGVHGNLLGDLIALLLVLSIVSGSFCYGTKRRLANSNHNGEGKRGTASNTPGKGEWKFPPVEEDPTPHSPRPHSRAGTR